MLFESRFAAVTLIAGSLLLVAYAALTPFVLGLVAGSFDYVAAVNGRWWRPLNATALSGVLLLLFALDPLYAIVRTKSWGAWFGYVLLKLAFVLQACKITWQLFLDPVIAARPEAAFLFRDGVFLDDIAIGWFRAMSAAAIAGGVLLFGAALYRSGRVPSRALALIVAGAAGYVAGMMVSIYLATAGIVFVGAGCVMLGLAVWPRDRITA